MAINAESSIPVEHRSDFSKFVKRISELHNGSTAVNVSESCLELHLNVRPSGKRLGIHTATVTIDVRSIKVTTTAQHSVARIWLMGRVKITQTDPRAKELRDALTKNEYFVGCIYTTPGTTGKVEFHISSTSAETRFRHIDQ